MMALALVLNLAPSPSRAYITSAQLEYCGADRMRFYVNGVQLRNGKNWTGEHIWDYAVYSSADGTLPLGLFKNNEDNVLGAENWSQHQDLNVSCWGYYYTSILTKLDISFRLTLKQSVGDPIVVWSEPGTSKMFHLDPGQAVPAGWYGQKYDDSSWKVAKTTHFEEEYLMAPELEDPHFSRFLVMGMVPFVSHNSNGAAGANTKNLFRSHFMVPNHPDSVRFEASQTSLKRGQTVRLSISPGRDAAYMEGLKLQAFVPAGLEPQSAGRGRWDSATRSITWSFPKPVTVTAAFLESVVSAPGWTFPERAFGPFKPGKGSERKQAAGEEYMRGAGFQSGVTGWFKFGKFKFSDSPSAPRIVGVIFHSQMIPGNCHDNIKSQTGDNTDKINFNYSVDGTSRGFLKQDVNLARWSNSEYYMDGYYDASDDREWTWTDLKNLQVQFHDVQSRTRKTDGRLSSCEVDVAYYQPSDVAVTLDLQVTEPMCKNVTVWARVWDSMSNAITQKPVSLSLNAAVCIPTPTQTRTRTPIPTKTFTPAPTATKVPTPKPGTPSYTPVPPTAVPTRTPLPTVTPRPTVVRDNQAVAVTGLSSNPEPFKRGGVFVYFTLSEHATVELKVKQGETVVRTLKGGEFEAGKNQLFYNGLGDNGRLLLPGTYTYEVWATGKSGVPGRGRATFAKEEDLQDVR